MKTTLLLIRHGETDWNIAGRWQGHRDVPLNEKGMAQAHALARRLAGWPVAALYSSDLQRAYRTAVTVGRALGLEPIHEPLLRERHVGTLEGMSRTEIIAKYPHLVEELLQHRFNPPDGEGQIALRHRAVAAYQKIIQAHPQKMIALVSHGGLLNQLISHVLDLPEDRDGRLSLNGNTGLSIVGVYEHGPRLELLNDTSHLVAENLHPAH